MEEEKQNFEQNSQSEQKEKIKEIHHYHYGEKRSGFNLGKFFLGLMIIFFGFLLLARNAGWVNVNLNFDWTLLWPIIVILIGFSMIRFHGWFGVTLGVFVVLVLAGLIFLMVFNKIDFNGQKNIIKKVIEINKEEVVKSVKISVSTGAGNLKIKGGSDKLISGNFQSNFLNLNQESELEDNIQKVVLKAEGKWPRFFGKKWNDLDLQINSETPTKLLVRAGASNINLDLSEIMIEEIDIDTGASSVEIILGDKLNESKISIDAGVSSLNIKIPQTVGVKLNIDSGLSSKNLNGFQKIDDNNYQSDNYETVEKKMDIDLDLGVSSLNIDWQ